MNSSLKVYSQLGDLYKSIDRGRPWTLALGNFDGFHRGHQALFQRLEYFSKNFQNPTALLTFEPHPKEVLSPKIPWRRIWGPWDLKNYLSRTPLTALIQQKFDEDFSQIEPHVFLDEWIGPLRPETIVVGHDFSFGRNRSGGLEDLFYFAQKIESSISLVEAVSWAGERVSTTQIKGLLSQGLIPEAQDLLNHPVTLGGAVIHGKKLGRTISVPTANVQTSIQPALALGVYAVQVTRQDPSSSAVDLKSYLGVANLGLAPTVNQDLKSKLEVHLFDFQEDIYGQDLNVTFVSYLRPEKKFASLEDLKKQINLDIHQARGILNCL